MGFTQITYNRRLHGTNIAEDNEHWWNARHRTPNRPIRIGYTPYHEHLLRGCLCSSHGVVTHSYEAKCFLLHFMLCVYRMKEFPHLVWLSRCYTRCWTPLLVSSALTGLLYLLLVVAALDLGTSDLIGCVWGKRHIYFTSWSKSRVAAHALQPRGPSNGSFRGWPGCQIVR